MIHNTGFNFSNIRNCVSAAESLQDAGKDDDARKILNDLGNELTKKDDKK